MSIGLLLAVYLVVHLLAAYLLATGGVLADFRRRPLSEMERTDGSEVLAEAPDRWIENHEFWQLSETASGDTFWRDEADEPGPEPAAEPSRPVRTLRHAAVGQ